MKIYIGGKITGQPNFKENFEKAEETLTNAGHKCMNPAKLPEGFPWEVYMPICYAMIDACEGIYLLKDWKDSKGAKLEYEYAVSKGKAIMYQGKA